MRDYKKLIVVALKQLCFKWCSTRSHSEVETHVNYGVKGCGVICVNDPENRKEAEEQLVMRMTA